MTGLVFPPVSAQALALADTVAIVAFTIVGILSHRGSLPLSAVAEDTLPLLAGWFAAAAAFQPYARRTRRSLLLTWIVGIPLGVLVRAAVLGRLDEPRQLAFLATTLILSIVFVTAARAVTGIVASRR
jgi:uncharacterized membrane protein HdeD (DUF308 family)